MKDIRTKILVFLAGSLILLAGCMPDNPTMPPVPELDGLIQLGWDSYEAAEYTDAIDFFEQAIECSASSAKAYLGAGWTAIFLIDYWDYAGNFFYMATQFDGGNCPLLEVTEILVQDTSWTVFQCVDPVLPDSVTDVIEALGETWIDWPEAGDTTMISEYVIGQYLYGAGPFSGFGPDYGDIPFKYRFQVSADNCIAMFSTENGFTGTTSYVDSIVVEGSETWIYLYVPHTDVRVTGDHYHTWLAADNPMTCEYFTYTPGSGAGQITWDALAGWALLEDIRGDNGNALRANAAILGLKSSNPGYVFGSGEYWSGIESMTMVQLKGVAAAAAYRCEAYRFAWLSCTSEGYGLSLDPESETFAFELMQVIDEMLIPMP